MKRNLKNRPSHRGFAFGEDTTKDFDYARDCIIWFEGFEKELRDSLTWLLTMWHPRKDIEIAKRQAIIDEIKAILGEG